MASAGISKAGRMQREKPRRMPLFWRVVSYLFLFILINLIANLVRVGLDALHMPSLLSRLAFAFIYIGGLLGITFAYRRFVDRQPWSGIGLPALSAEWPRLVTGLIMGILVITIVFAVEYAAGWIQVRGTVDGAQAAFLLVDSLLLGAAFGASEEICMRGYLFQNLGESRPIWQATLVAGIIFSAFHLLSVGFGARGATFFIFALVLNVFLVLSRLATGSLWLAIGFHTAFDWAAINLGLGSVVLADQHLVQVQRDMPVPAEDLLAALIVGIGVMMLLIWIRRQKVVFAWNAHLDAEGKTIGSEK